MPKLSLELKWATDAFIANRDKFAILHPSLFPEFVKNYFGYDMGKYHREMFLKYYFDDRILRTLIEAPMGFAKTEYLSKIYPIWRICRNRRWTMILASSTYSLPQDCLRAIIHQLGHNEKLIDDFGNFFDAKSKVREDMFYVLGSDYTQPPTMRIGAVGGEIIGKRADEIIGDDLLSLKNTSTKKMREHTKLWIDMQLLTRVRPDGLVRFLGSDYGEYCYYQDIIKNRGGQYDDWRCHVYKALEPGVNIGPLGELWPEYWPMEKMLARKKEVGTLVWETSYQNNPKAMVGFMLKDEWYRTFKREEMPSDLMTFQGVDLAVSLQDDACHFVILTVGLDTATENYYVYDILRTRIEFPEQVEAIRQHDGIHRPLAVGIDSQAYQVVMAQQLRKLSAVPLRECRSSIPKEQAIMAMSVLFENGKIHVEERLEKFREEYLTWTPTGDVHPDQLDALRYALSVSNEFRTRGIITTSEYTARPRESIRSECLKIR